MKVKNKIKSGKLKTSNKKGAMVLAPKEQIVNDAESQDMKLSNNVESTEEMEEDIDAESDDYVDEDKEENDDEDNGEVPSGSVKRKHAEAGQAKSAKRSKLSVAALTKAPTAKELNQLRETENLFHSNLFRLQIEEMLKEIKPKSKHEILLKRWMENLTSVLLSMKVSKRYLFLDPRWLKKFNIELPCVEKAFTKLANEKPDGCIVMKPSSISVVGSYTSQCFLGPNIQLDVQVEMPKECFLKCDEENYRYHIKRAVYLCYIAHTLQTSDLAEDLHFSQNHNAMSPVLELKPTGKLAKAVVVRLHVTSQADTFKMTKFVPSMSNISSSSYFEAKEKLQQKATNSPTPHYNSSVLRDMTMTANYECLSRAITGNPNIRDGIILLKVWLRQRQLDKGYGGFSGYIISMYVVYLFQSRRLNSMMSSYQVARNTWNELARSDWCTEGIILSQLMVENRPPLDEFHSHFEVVFVDVTGFFNICSEVRKETFLRVQEESKLAVKWLDTPSTNSFQALFLTPKPLHLQCDHMIRFQDETVSKLAKKSSARQQMDYGQHFYPQALSLILESLRCGLARRVSLLCIQLPNVMRWPVSSKPLMQSESIALGLILDPDHAYSIIEKGPEANVQEAEVFRAYWGERCELRRFQDGSISEVVVWDKSNAPASKKRLITRQIVSYLLNSKLSLKDDDFAYLADQFDPVLETIREKPSEFDYGTGEEASLRVVKSFDSLVKQLRLLPNMPLDVSAVQGSSSVFRFADVFPPLAKKHWSKETTVKPGFHCVFIQGGKPMKVAPHWVQPINGVIQLGLSSKWPDELDAIRRIQAAFYVSIANQLLERNGVTCQAHPNHVDVYKDSFVFRLQLGNQREIAVMKKMTTLEGVTKFRDTKLSIEVEKRVDHLPKITSALLGVHQQFTSFGPACCLAKRWLRSQLLDETHFPDICIDLLVAMLYIQPQPFTPTNQPQVAFFRFLRLMAMTNWHQECIVLNFNDILSREDILQIEGTFNNSRSSLPVLFIATSFDTSGSVWTKCSPTLQILIRVAQLASEAMQILDTCFFTATTTDVVINQFFLPVMDIYNVIIRLNGRMCPRLYQRILKPTDEKSTSVTPYVYKKGEKIPVTGFDPVQIYLQQLRESYGEFALFFHDPYGGDCIGVLWKPAENKEFKVSNMNGRKLTARSTLAINQDAIIEDFYIIGEGLVKTIETKN